MKNRLVEFCCTKDPMGKKSLNRPYTLPIGGSSGERVSTFQSSVKKKEISCKEWCVDRVGKEQLRNYVLGTGLRILRGEGPTTQRTSR